MTQANALNTIRTDFGNGPGQHTAGLDIQINYTLPFGPGDLTLAATATQVMTDENTATELDGFTVAPADDRLGFLNYAVVGFASPELRANVSINYALDQHNFRLAAQYVSGVTDERGPVTPGGFLPGSSTPYSTTFYGVESGDWLSFDFTYLFRVTEDLRLTATVANITDEDPPQSRQELGYDPRMGSPLGRTFEIGDQEDLLGLWITKQTGTGGLRAACFRLGVSDGVGRGNRPLRGQPPPSASPPPPPPLAREDFSALLAVCGPAPRSGEGGPKGRKGPTPKAAELISVKTEGWRAG